MEFEGRLHDDFHCFICENPIEKNIILKRAFLPTHPNCISGKIFDVKSIKSLYKNKNTIYVEDEDINKLWEILLEGF